MDKLQAIAPLKHACAATGKVVFESAQIKIAQAPRTWVYSVRQSRKHPDAAVLAACLQSFGVSTPEKPNCLSGDARLGCAWLEPHAWLVLAEQVVQPVLSPDLLVTEISDRVCLFKLSGEGARDVIAAGCDPQMITVGAMARTRFGSVVNVVIERHAEHEYRLILDVSLASAFSAWIAQAASNQ